MHYAHGEGVIHRDIKPENILIHNGRPMVADFGIALAVSAAAGGRMTETGLSLGTPHYMSPEQATAEKDLTARSDVYSLGSVLYEMLTGEPPHLGGSAQAIIMKIVTEEARPVTELRKSVPPHVAAATAKSLERLAADRFESAAKFAEALTNPNFTLPTTQAATLAGVPASGPWKRVSIGVAVLAAVMTVLFVWALLRPIPKPVSRYSIALPVEEALSGFPLGVAVSPDGSPLRLVYVGEGEQSSRLLVRDLDQLHATPLAGTEGAESPFFSPDGSRVGFYVLSEGVWRAASLGGGPPITIADSGTGRGGGSWGSDGYLYFDGSLPGNGLVRVAEGRGAPDVVTMIDTTQGEQEHARPEALPGGRGVVFTVRRGGLANTTEWDIAVADLATGTHTVLLRGVRAWYAASGHLLYVTADGTLMVVPFDETTLALTGDAVALVEGLRVGFGGNMNLAVSTTGTLFYTTGRAFGAGGGLADLVWVTRDGTVTEIQPGWTEDFGWPELSPDGTQLAVSIVANAETQIWIKQLGRGSLPKLTFTGTRNFRPAWTPDGRSVAFVSDRGHNQDLYVRRADAGAPAELLLDDEWPLWEVTYAPDGEWLVYRVQEEGTTALYALRVGVDSTPVPLIVPSFGASQPAVSPDGRWLAYRSNESGRGEVYVRPFPNTSDGKWQVSTDGGREPLWAHSGRELFYRDRGTLMSVEVLPGPNFVYGEPRALFSLVGIRSAGSHPQYDVAPDDQGFVMIRNQRSETATELIVVENFFEELKAKVGN